MKPFRSPTEMLDAHELMFGDAGRRCAEIVVKWAATLFAVPLDPLNIRVVLAPVELGPYNRHTGYHYGDPETGAFILGNRHIAKLHNGTLVLTEQSDQFLIGFEDFIVHELTHARQGQLERQHRGEPGWERKRGDHRCLGWYAAVAEACPRYLGVELPRSSWPRGPRTPDGTLTEVQMTHWPRSLRWLAEKDDPRLPKVGSTRVDVQQPVKGNKMTAQVRVVAQQNPCTGTWEVGWKSDDGEFMPHWCGYATQEEAEAEIPGFDERVERETEAMLQQLEADEREQNKRWPNVGYVRAQIKKLRDSGKREDLLKSLDAGDKLYRLLDMDLHEHISWPLPSWKAIESGRVY